VAGMVFGGATRAQDLQAKKAAEKKSAPTFADAKKFLEEAERRLFDLSNKAQRASWVEENFITDDTEQIAADANQELSGFSAEMSKKAHDFDKLALPPEMARKMLLMKLSAGFPAPADPKEQKELAQVLASLDGDYGKGKWCPGGDAAKCLDVTAVGKLMATSHDPEELKRAWVGWHAVGAPMRQRYARMVELGNAGSRELGFADAGALWRSNYDMPGYQTAVASTSIRVAAPITVILVGAALGGLLAAGLKRSQATPSIATEHREPTYLLVLRWIGAMAGAMLLSCIGTILLSRLADTQFPIRITISDLWGAIAVGFVTAYSGAALLEKYLGPTKEKAAQHQVRTASSQPERGGLSILGQPEVKRAIEEIHEDVV